MKCLFSAFSAPAILAFSRDTRNEKYKVLIKEWFSRAFRLTDEINATYFQASTSVPVVLVPFTGTSREPGSKAGLRTAFLFFSGALNVQQGLAIPREGPKLGEMNFA